MDDPVFQRVWRDTFLIHPTLRVPWKVILGNHDYQVRVDVFGVGCCCWLLLLAASVGSAGCVCCGFDAVAVAVAVAMGCLLSYGQRLRLTCAVVG